MLTAEVDVLELIGHAEEVVQIEQCRGPVAAGSKLE